MGIQVKVSRETFALQIPRDVAGPLDRSAATVFLQSLNKGGLVELINFAAETLAARTSMSQLDRVMFERWRDELQASAVDEAKKQQ